MVCHGVLAPAWRQKGEGTDLTQVESELRFTRSSYFNIRAVHRKRVSIETRLFSVCIKLQYIHNVVIAIHSMICYIILNIAIII
jgi:hypothetical protein